MSDEPIDEVPPPLHTRRRTALWVFAALVTLLIVCSGIASLISLPLYAITPGVAQDVAPLIATPKASTYTHVGKVLLTDVDLVPLRALTYLYFKASSENEIVSSKSLIGAQTPASYNEEGVIDMVQAREAASVAAFHALGYRAQALPDGVVVYDVPNASPATPALHSGDVIVSLGQTPTLTQASLARALASRKPGTSVAITVHAIGSTKTHVVRSVLGTVQKANGATTCARTGETAHGSGNGCIGIAIEQLYRTADAPFKVSIDSGGIVGPSAGLAFALGFVQKLDPSDLANGKVIAATGTMNIDGAVGDVGGVAQKTVAVERAGATIFFVPPEELAIAKAHATGSLRVIAVSSLSEALTQLVRLGGHLPRPASARS